MTTHWLLEDMQIAFLKNFLDHVGCDVAAEWDQIDERNSRGDFPDYTDYEAALNFPLARLELAAKAILYELNALVEARLHALAEHPWQLAAELPGPKTISELRRVHPESLSRVKMVSDLSLKQIIKLIEAHYTVTLADLTGWDQFENNRAAVNSFKHRGGRKHNRDINWWSKDVFSEIRH
jgi:hypothetical protein